MTRQDLVRPIANGNLGIALRTGFVCLGIIAFLASWTFYQLVGLPTAYATKDEAACIEQRMTRKVESVKTYIIFGFEDVNGRLASIEEHLRKNHKGG